ncbi:hypothetical protein DRN93_03920 [archaeon]|nr:MAG: hypothetical protein DRN93_03920 [archaeon]
MEKKKEDLVKEIEETLKTIDEVGKNRQSVRELLKALGENIARSVSSKLRQISRGWCGEVTMKSSEMFDNPVFVLNVNTLRYEEVHGVSVVFKNVLQGNTGIPLMMVIFHESDEDYVVLLNKAGEDIVGVGFIVQMYSIIKRLMRDVKEQIEEYFSDVGKDLEVIKDIGSKIGVAKELEEIMEIEDKLEVRENE